ncbi:MAG: hypothetical protein DMF44_11705 [Verrucomicrobia bacterium]|nr:MAG: hypothetical protein DMF44_11705 [Verrucomicrobiota bacterium]
MHLIIFDIDGTLTETIKIDEECFVRSFKDVFGFADIDTDWSHYPHTTDSSIFHEIYVSSRGRTPTAPDVSRFRQHFIGLLAAASSQSPFAPVSGADRLLSRLAQRGSHRSFTPPCMLVTEFGMLAQVAVLAFRLLALAQGVERHDCLQRVLFMSSLISVTRIHF